MDFKTLKEAIVKEVLEGVRKQPTMQEGCPEGQKMVDGECVPMKEMSQEKNMADATKQPETAEKKPEAQATPAPAAANPPTTVIAQPDPVKSEIDSMKEQLKGHADVLGTISEKVSALVLKADLKSQSELKTMLEQAKALTDALTNAQPPVSTDKLKTPNPVQDYSVVDWTVGLGAGKRSIDERASHIAKQWGLEVKEEEPEPEPTKIEEDPVKAEIGTLRSQLNEQSEMLKNVADKVSGLVEALTQTKSVSSEKASTPVPSAVVNIAKDKKSIASEEGFDMIDWTSDTRHGASIDERAKAISERWGLKEKA